MFVNHTLSKNNRIDALEKRENVECAALCFISKLGPKQGGKENLQAEGSLSRHKLCEILVAKNGGKRGEAEGKARKRSKSLCSSFWKRTLVEPSETPDSLQRARHYSLTFPSLAI